MRKSTELECNDHENTQQDSLGVKLANARKNANLTIDDVAAKLFLSPITISEIETDSIPDSANTVFSKGYVKLYCVLLELPVEEYLRLFQLQYQCNGDVKKMQTFSNRSKNTTHNNYLNWITLIFLCIMTIGVIGWWWQDSQQQAPTETQQVSVSTPIEPSPRLPITPNIQQTNTTSDPSLVFTTMSFKQDCWVKITDATNAVVAVGIKKAGSTLELSGIAPLEVVLGAPLGVEITYGQQKLDISPYISNDTATFTLPLEQ